MREKAVWKIFNTGSIRPPLETITRAGPGLLAAAHHHNRNRDLKGGGELCDGRGLFVRPMQMAKTAPFVSR